MLRPFALQGAHHLALGFGEYDVDPDGVRLLVALDAVDGLDEVVEAEPDADENGAVAVPLEVATRSGQGRFGSEDPELAFAEVDDALLALVEVLGSVHLDHFGQHRLDGAALILEVVPQDEVIAW